MEIKFYSKLDTNTRIHTVPLPVVHLGLTQGDYNKMDNKSHQLADNRNKSLY